MGKFDVLRAAYLANVVRTELNIPLRQNYNYFQLHGNLTPEQTFGRKTEADKLYLQFNKNSNYIQNYQNAAAKYKTIWKSLTGE